jgi:hypothetical protein
VAQPGNLSFDHLIFRFHRDSIRPNIRGPTNRRQAEFCDNVLFF